MRPYYKQKDTEGNKGTFLYSEEGMWWVSNTLGKSAGERLVGEFFRILGLGRGILDQPLDRLINHQNTAKPPTSQWYFWDGKKHNDEDTTLTLTFKAFSPCKLVRVAGGDMVVERQLDSFGDYRS